MPGLNFVQQYEACRPSLAAAVEKGQRALPALPWLETRELARGETFALTCQTHAGYPVFHARGPRFDLALEGFLYTIQKDRLEDELTALAELVFDTEADDDRLARWLVDRDGDYLIWLHDRRTQRTALLNDIFGRLPVVYYSGPHGAAASRSLRFVHAQVAAPRIDRLGLAHTMLLGHALGDKTLFDDIRYLPPATLLLILPQRRALRTRRVFTLEFSRLNRGRLDVAENAADLCDSFTAACRARAGCGGAKVVSLSGGLDSRAVAAGLARGGGPLYAATFYRKGYTSDDEVRIAAQVARRLRVDWQRVDLAPLTSGDALELLRLKGGQSPLYMGFILPFFRTLRQCHGPRMVYLTGDGGDQFLPRLLPPLFIPSSRGVCDTVLQRYWLNGLRLGARLTAALTGLAERDLLQSLRAYLQGLPERTWTGKWLHYQFHENIRKTYLEAEDRNRFYFWSTSPFYGNAFALRAINCPQRLKTGFALYRAFLERLAPAMARVEYSGFHAPLGSPRFRLRLGRKKIVALRPIWLLGIKNRLKKADTFAPGAAILAILRRQVEGTPELGSLLDRGGLRDLLRHPEKHEKPMITTLFNTMALLEDWVCGHSSLAVAPPDTVLETPPAGGIGIGDERL